MEQRFINAIAQIEEEHKMTYVNTIERVALRRGREEGKQEGLKEGKQAGLEAGRREAVSDILATQIARRFGEMPHWVQARLAEADQSSLDRWAVQILDAQRIEDVFA